MAIPNIFANATTQIPLLQLDQNFATPITIGSNTVTLGNTITSISGLTLVHPTIDGATSTGSTGTGNVVFSTAPTFDTNFSLRSQGSVANTAGGSFGLFSSTSTFALGGSGPTAWYQGDASQYYPVVDNTRSCGTAGLRWSVIYAATGTINTSDETEKQWRGPLTTAELAAAKDIMAQIGGFQYLSAIAAKGDAARIHIGLRAQQVGQIFVNHGLDPARYGLYCYDAWVGDRITGQTAGSRYGLRPDELAYFLIASLDQRLSAAGF